MLFILLSNCSFAVVSLARAIIKPVEWIMWPGKSHRGSDEEMEGEMGLHWLCLVFECPMTMTMKTSAHGCATKCPHFWMCVRVWMCAVCQKKEQDFQDISCRARKNNFFFFFVLFFIWCYHSGVCSRFSLFSRGLTPKLSVLGSLRYTLHSFFLSFWSSWWSLKPPLLPFEHWNRHDKDLVQLLVSLLFLVLSKQMESKQHL